MTKASHAICIVVALWTNVSAQECSKYLGDNQRSGYVETELPTSPALLWTYNEKHPPRHAWKEPNREIQYIDFDYATQVAIGHGMVYFGSSADHKVHAVDLATGEEKWSFYTEGPIRFAPVVHRDRVYIASDDGHVYSLLAESGRLMWKLYGGPRNRKLMGNEQMISHWPARSGVLVGAEDRLYCTFGMWSRDGVFIYCLDAREGKVIWKNDTSGFHYMGLPHLSGFGGVAPQGYLVLHRNTLCVATGRAAPAAFDAVTGEFLYHDNEIGYKPHQPGGSWILAWKDWFIFKRRLQHMEEDVRYEERDPGSGRVSGVFAIHYRTGKRAWSLTDKNLVVAKGDMLTMAGAGPVIKVNGNDLMEKYPSYYKDGKPISSDPNLTEPKEEYVNKNQETRQTPAWMNPNPYNKWEAEVGRVFFMLQAGDTVITGGRGKVSGIDFNSGKMLWQKKISGNARGICAHKGHFVVSSTDGRIYCFGKGADTGKQITHAEKEIPVSAEAERFAESIVKNSGIGEGYCVMLGADKDLIHALVSVSDLMVYCLEPNEEKLATVRKSLDDAGILGVRAQIHLGDFEKLPYQKYVANLIVYGDRLGSGPGALSSAELYRILRPCGGVAYQVGAKEKDVREWLTAGRVPETKIASVDNTVMVKRGQLPGSGEWTHPHANVGRTRSSEDRLAKLPLEMLWWGGPGPARMVSRHWYAPIPLVANGMIYIQGQHDIIGVDAYNGREVWNRHIENIGRFPPYLRGGNIVADDDSVYCVKGTTCFRLAAATGKTIKEYVFPVTDAHIAELEPHIRGKFDPVWEYLGMVDKYIIGTLAAKDDLSIYKMGMTKAKCIFVFDKQSGKLLWEHKAEKVILHTAIVADTSRLYYLDRAADGKRTKPAHGSTLVVLDIATGKLVRKQKGISAKIKSLMLKDDVLVTLPATAGKLPIDQETGVQVYSASSGKLLWEEKAIERMKFVGRGTAVQNAFIVDDTIYLPHAFNLLSGKELFTRKDPLTGEESRFDMPGKNFCGTVGAGADLIAFRSASIGFQEISKDSGAFWLPEVRPSCWISVVVAGGIVAAPEGYSTCICPYNYKTSLALVTADRNEDWSIYLNKGGIRRLQTNEAPRKVEPPSGKGIIALRANLNAPGDKLGPDSSVWMAWPRPTTGRYVRDMPIVQKVKVDKYRFNSDAYDIGGTEVPWLYTSGMEGALKLDIFLSDGKQKRNYNVRIHFAEIRGAKPGERVFDVKIGGKTVISRLDIAKEAGGKDKALVKKLDGIPVSGTMTIEFASKGGKPPLVSAIEIVEAD